LGHFRTDGNLKNQKKKSNFLSQLGWKKKKTGTFRRLEKKFTEFFGLEMKINERWKVGEGICRTKLFVVFMSFMIFFGVV